MFEGVTETVDMSCLYEGKIYWDDWRFEPWSDGTASGLYRRADFIKASLVGEVGRYAADDYIVWRYEEGDIERIFRAARPEPGLMLQRYLFVRPEGKLERKSRSFCLGFKGFVDVWLYTPKSPTNRRLRDLSQLVDVAWTHHLRMGESASSPEVPAPQKAQG